MPWPRLGFRAIQGAFGCLDTVSALALLRDLTSDEALPPGARFETFVFADRVMGLELARQAGQPRD